MKTIFSIGHYSINVFGLFIAIGLVVGYLIAMKEAKRRNFSTDSMADIILYAIIPGVIGARLYYILVFDLSYYINNPNKILAIRDGGLSIQGALIGGAMGVLIYTGLKKINVWKAADIMAPGIILGQAIGRVGCDVFGIVMNKAYPWGVLVQNQLYHPAQMYESLLNYLLFGVLWARRKSIKYDGQLFFTYLIGFSINRFIVEFFRVNPLVIKPFSVAHLTSVGLICVSILVMGLLRNKSSIDSSNQEKLFDISFKEISIILVMMMVSVVIYYGWIWA